MGKKQKHRTIVFYKTYFDDFFKEQKSKVKDKIIWTFDLIEELQRVPEAYLKYHCCPGKYVKAWPLGAETGA